MLSSFDGIGGSDFNPKRYDTLDGFGSQFSNSLNGFGGGGGFGFDASYGGSGSAWGPDLGSPIGGGGSLGSFNGGGGAGFDNPSTSMSMNNFWNRSASSLLSSSNYGFGTTPPFSNSDGANSSSQFNMNESLNDYVARMTGFNPYNSGFNW